MSGSVSIYLFYGFKRDEIPGSPHPEDDLGLEWFQAGTEMDGNLTDFAGVELCGNLDGFSEEFTDASFDFTEWDRMKNEFGEKLRTKNINVRPRIFMAYLID